MGEGEGVIGTIVAQYSGAPSSAVAYLQVVHCSLLERFLSDHCVDRVTRNPGWGGGGWAQGGRADQGNHQQNKCGYRPTAEEREDG